jgi:hypothetical protein
MTQEYVTKKPYGDVRFKELVKVKEPIDATVSFGNKRMVFHGQLVVDHIEQSWKWGDQVTINVWLKDPPEIETRAYNDGYSRVAIALPIGLARRFCETLLEKLWELGI